MIRTSHKRTFLTGSEGLIGLHPLARLVSAAALLLGILSAVRINGLLLVSLPILGGLALNRTSIPHFLAGLRHLIFFFVIVLIWPVATLGWSAGITSGAVSALRILLVYCVGYWLVQSADRWELAGALDRLLAPFSRLSRITPLLVLTMELLPALTRTGVRLRRIIGSRCGSRRWNAVVQLPLFLEACIATCFHRGECLERALVARHFHGIFGPRGQCFQNHWRLPDYFCVLVSVLCAAMLILYRFKG